MIPLAAEWILRSMLTTALESDQMPKKVPINTTATESEGLYVHFHDPNPDKDQAVYQAMQATAQENLMTQSRAASDLSTDLEQLNTETPQDRPATYHQCRLSCFRDQ